MKNSLLFSCSLLLLGFVTTAHAQLDATLNLTSIYASNPQVGVEYAISDKFGIGLDIGIPVGRYDLTVSSSENTWRRTGVIGSLMAKLYFGPEEPTTGLYAAAYARFRNITFDDREIDGDSFDSDDLKINRLALGLALGAKYTFAERFVIDANAGAGFAPTRNNDLIDSFDDSLGFFDSLEAIDFFVRLAVGYRLIP